MSGRTWEPAVFDRIYAGSEDPWLFRSSPYEREKYRATLALLGERRFASGLEIGCSIGVLTAQLAGRCGSLVAIDCAEAALARAAESCPGVRFERHFVPGSFPAGRFELIVVSEVLYFLSLDDVGWLAALSDAALLPGGTVVLANWTGQTDTPTTGEAAADAFVAALRTVSLVETCRAETYRLDLLRWREVPAGAAAAD